MNWRTILSGYYTCTEFLVIKRHNWKVCYFEVVCSGLSFIEINKIRHVFECAFTSIPSIMITNDSKTDSCLFLLWLWYWRYVGLFQLTWGLM